MLQQPSTSFHHPPPFSVIGERTTVRPLSGKSEQYVRNRRI